MDVPSVTQPDSKRLLTSLRTGVSRSWSPLDWQPWQAGDGKNDRKTSVLRGSLPPAAPAVQEMGMPVRFALQSGSTKKPPPSSRTKHSWGCLAVGGWGGALSPLTFILAKSKPQVLPSPCLAPCIPFWDLEVGWKSCGLTCGPSAWGNLPGTGEAAQYQKIKDRFPGSHPAQVFSSKAGSGIRFLHTLGKGKTGGFTPTAPRISATPEGRTQPQAARPPAVIPLRTT